ncbi:MAG: GntR family transcriptional regulator [Pyrinomonadaceae bacterium]
MYITIDEQDGRPMYRQVVDGIKELIARGELAAGSGLPPVRQVAADLGVNLNTIAFAYRELQKVGLIRIRHGSGAVVVAQVTGQSVAERQQAKLRAALTDLVLAGLSRAEVLAIVNNVLNNLMGSKNR